MTEEEKRYWDEALFKINSKMEDILNRLSISEEDFVQYEKFSIERFTKSKFQIKRLRRQDNQIGEEIIDRIRMHRYDGASFWS